MPLDVILEPLPLFLSVISGIAVGFSLGLFGGGGSILAVPMLVYLVGVKDAHVAIGTSALAVGAIAVVNLLKHKRKGNLRFRKGLMFALPGVVGTLLGAQFGLWTPPDNLLLLFAAFMVLVGVLMIKKQRPQMEVSKQKSRLILVKKNLPLSGFLVGILAGYFGIGGGFLIVPTMMFSGGLNIIQAIGTSLVSVSSFGLVTAGRYFIEGNVDVLISSLFIVGGLLGGHIGVKYSETVNKDQLVKIFSIILFTVALYITIQTLFV